MKWNLLFIFFLALIATYFVIPIDKKPGFESGQLLENKKIRLGLDLSFGCKLIVKVDKENKLRGDELKKAADRAIEVFNRRLSGSGLKEPKISKLGDDKILILMPGTDKAQVDFVTTVLSTVGILEFKEEAEPDTKEEWKKLDKAPEGYETIKFEEREGGESDEILVKSKPLITGEHIVTANYSTGLKGYEVNLKLNDKGKRLFAKSTEALVKTGGRIAIILDGKCISAPVVQQKIPHGEAQITGNFKLEEAKQLAIALRTGSLKSKIEVEHMSFVGPSLGQDSVNKGFLASIIAFASICFFMIFYYRIAGFVSCVSLFLNLLFLLFILSIFEATLTMPGIAGIVLTLGMAVDANIIIYERIRDEISKGKSAKLAFEAGYERAYTAIFDANITTLITALILYYFGTDVIQGFAITLSIGILTTMFTGLFCTKVFIRTLLNAGLINEFHFMRFLSKPKIKFMESAPVFAVISIILIVVSISIAIASGNRLFGIDFKGGNVVDVSLKNPMEIALIRAKFNSIVGENNIPKYDDAEIQSNYGRQAGFTSIFTTHPSREFEIRTSKGNPDRVFDLGKENLVREGVAKEFHKFLFYPRFDQLSKEEIKESLEIKFKDEKIGTFEVEEYEDGGFLLLMPVKVSETETISHDFLKRIPEILETTFKLSVEIERDITKLFRDNLEQYSIIHIGVFKSVLEEHELNGGNKYIVNLKNEMTLSEIEDKLKKTFSEAGLDEPLVREYIKYGEEGPDKVDDTKKVKQFELIVHPEDNDKFLATKKAIENAKLGLTDEPFPLVSRISPLMAAELRRSGTISVILSWIAIIIYLAIRFSFKFGVSAVFALIHDVVISLGAVSAFILLVPPEVGVNVEVGLVSISAFLTIVGYSVNDTIVTFDRIRENLKEMRRESQKNIINASLNQVLARSILTSFTTFIAVAVLFFITARSSSGISAFTYPFMIGLIVGTYSSIFVASPLLIFLPKLFNIGGTKKQVITQKT